MRVVSDEEEEKKLSSLLLVLLTRVFNFLAHSRSPILKLCIGCTDCEYDVRTVFKKDTQVGGLSEWREIGAQINTFVRCYYF